MKKEVNPIDKTGFSTKFFEDLAKEHDKIDELASKQKQLKQKHLQSNLK
ncbi:hypothetical protein [Candidatus Nitrosotenuis cloacae]|nr:hypothetical protein [Candidatus Nitrosotenuis cloacae]